MRLECGRLIPAARASLINASTCAGLLSLVRTSIARPSPCALPGLCLPPVVDVTVNPFFRANSAIPTHGFPQRDLVLFVAYGVIVLTLVVPGLTLAPLLLIGEGTSEIQRMVIGKKLLQRHKS